jgi:hypothetical protein
MDIAAEFLSAIINAYEANKRLADRHVGQIVQVARIHAGEKWNTLTIPRGASEEYNKAHWGQRGKSHS